MYQKIILFILFPLFGFSQSPQKINFQSILRNTNGEIFANKTVSLKISIISGSISGSSVYSETHTKTTDPSGLISLQIGNGTVLSGVFANIAWGNAPHFIKLEADFSGGSNFVVLGTQELMSVPYALYASKTDTSALNLTSRLATKLNVTDTASLSERIDAKLTKTDTSLLNLTSRLATKLNVTDTTFLSERIDDKLNKTDTAFLSERIDAKLNKTDTSLLNLASRLATKLNVTDTAFLSNRIDTKLNKSDTSLLNLTSRLATKLDVTDTAFLSERIDTKLNKTDTSLLNLTSRLATKLNGTDTTFLSNRINTKLNISDFPLGTTPGNIQYWNGTTWVNLAPGQNGQTLNLINGIPSWSGAAYPTLTTSSISSITSTSVNGGGNISSDGGAAVSARGLVYATTSNPTLSNTALTIGSGTGSFSGTLTGLTPNTTYYIRAYATNSAGTGYGNEITFQTLPVAVPTLITTDASGITQTMVTSGGTISNDGGATISERGIVYSTSTDPTTSNTKVSSGSGTGSFSINITALTPNTIYYIRSYAINSVGTGYGNNITFQTTVPAVPSLTTRELLNITNTTATGGGSITNDGGSSITAKGICWGTSPNPTISDSKTSDGTGTETFTSFITGLSSSVTYYVRAYATNSTGTGYGNQQSFTSSSTSNTLPVVTSTSVTGLTTIQATFNAEVNSQGGGTVTERGAVWNTSGNPTVNSNRVPSGAGTGVYTATITSLSGGSNYYVRAYALNSFGISYGLEIPFLTPQGLPTVSIISVSVQSTGAGIEGLVTDAGGQSIIERGVVWNTTGTPTTLDNKIANGNSLGIYTTQISGLIIGSTYFVRTYATNASGTAYSNTRTITTALPPVVDIDGNYYDTVHIGNQIWFKQNLKTTRYRNGGNIPYVLGNTDWQALTTGAWSYYDHDVANDPIYGKLYNWYTTLGDTLCPTGWHVPTDAEWTILTDYLGGESVAGGKMKAVGTDYWYNPNTGATNETGFSALPSGLRLYDGGFHAISFSAFFWSNLGLTYGDRDVRRINYYINYKSTGGSVRCLKD